MTKSYSSIIIVHNMSMQRVTISLPKYLYEALVQRIPTGKVSRFAAQALEKELMQPETDPFVQFISLRKTLPKKKKQAILKAMKKGRA